MRIFKIQNIKKIMDPTKPILDLYNDSYYHNSSSGSRPTRQPPIRAPVQPKYNQQSRKVTSNNTQKQISYTELKQKYQQLYQAYNEKAQKINDYQNQMSRLKQENDRMRNEVYRLQDKNEHLNATLLNKNIELQEAYRQLQEDLKKGGRAKRNDDAIDRLEDGLREAINSNFHLLREASLSEVKHYSSRN